MPHQGVSQPGRKQLVLEFLGVVSVSFQKSPLHAWPRCPPRTYSNRDAIPRELVFRKLSQLLVMQAGLRDAVLPFPFSVFEQVTSCGLPFFDFDHIFLD